MDIGAILNGLKGKALDVYHIGLIKSAYDLQNEVVEQLRSNAEAMQESKNLLLERIGRLELEVAKLSDEKRLLAERMPPPNKAESYSPKGLPLKILKLYQDQGSTLIFDKYIRTRLGCSEIECSVAFDELSANDVVELSIIGDRGRGYDLTTAGKRRVLGLPAE